MRDMKNPKTEVMNVKNCSRVYKLTFENGDTYYGRIVLSKNYSASTYLKDMAGRPKLNALNPLRVNMTTEIERRVEKELKSIKSEIIFEGLTSEAIEFKDKMVETDKNSLNIRKNVVMGKVMAEAIKVTKEFSKVVKSSTGAVVSYVDREWARKKGLWDVLNFSNEYPLNSKFVEILKPIERI